MNRAEEAAEKMEGAEIRVSGPVIENKIDRLVYNAGQDITAKGVLRLICWRKYPWWK